VVNFFAIIVGSIVGLTVGFFAGWLFVEYRWIPNSMLWKGIAGAIVGGFAGGVAGSISGSLNRAGDTGANRLLLALTFGALFGVVGGTKLTILGRMLESLNIPSPFPE
jgi:hypothetical protein